MANGNPRKSPCLECGERTTDCHSSCRRYMLWGKINNAYHRKYLKDERELYAAREDMVRRSRSMARGGNPIVVQMKHKNTKERNGTK